MQTQPFRALILDMDGVLWKADSPIGNLASIFERIDSLGLRFAFATNNGRRTPEQYADRLAQFGIHAEPWQVVTSAMCLADLLYEKIPQGGPVFAIGENGLLSALSEKGFNLLNIEEADNAVAVVFGIDRAITYEKISTASLLVSRGLPFYGTNPDLTFPTPRGEVPGAGAWISVIEKATGRNAVFAGKPAPALIEMARKRLGTEKHETLVVGDRLETDIQGGQSAGCPVALVLSGVSTAEQAASWSPPVDLLAQDLASLLELIF